MPKIWVSIPELNKRVWLHIPDDVWPKKFKNFVKKIFAFNKPFSIRSAARVTGTTRETAAKYICIMEKNGLLDSIMNEFSKKIYFTETVSTLDLIETLIRNSPGCLERIGELICGSLRYILPALESL